MILSVKGEAAQRKDSLLRGKQCREDSVVLRRRQWSPGRTMFVKGEATERRQCCGKGRR